MKKFGAFLGGLGLMCALNSSVEAHDPPDYLGIIWQWPADKLPVLDGNISEWNVIPDEFWLTDENFNVQSCLGDNTFVGDLDPSNLSFRWTMTFTNGSSKTYWALERFDDDWQEWDDVEPTIDADHSGGTFWTIEGMTDEESERQKGRHAQIYHLFFDDGAHLGGDSWNWFWMTAGDWYEGPPYSDVAYRNTGTPLSGEEYTQEVEYFLTAWDDYSSLDPEGSVEHNFQEGEIIGLNQNVWDRDDTADGTIPNESRWNLSPNCESFGDADFLADYLLLEVDEEIMSTAVEADSWGNVKASFAK